MNKTVLVIDDSKTIQKAFEFTFRRTLFKYEKAFSGNEGFEKAKQIKPDLIILDFSLPDGDALALCKRFKSDPELAAVPVLICAGMASNITEEDAKAAGAFDLIRKPFETQAVLDLAEQAIKEAPAGAEILEELQVEEEQLAAQPEPVVEQAALLEPIEEEAPAADETPILEPIEEEQPAEAGADLLEPIEEPQPEQEVVVEEELPTLEPVSEEAGEIEDIQEIEPIEETGSELIDFPEAGADLEPIEEEPIQQPSVEITEEPVEPQPETQKTLEMFEVQQEEPGFSMEDLPSESEAAGDLEEIEEIAIEEPFVEESSEAAEEEVPPVIGEEDAAPAAEELEQVEVLEEVPEVEEAEEISVETQAVDLQQEPVEELQPQPEAEPEQQELTEAESIEIAEPEPVQISEAAEQPKVEEIQAYVSKFEEDVVLAAPPEESELLQEAKKQKEAFRPTAASVSLDEERITEIVVKALRRLAAEKLEAIAWEVVPELAEVIIKRELERITAEKG